MTSQYKAQQFQNMLNAYIKYLDCQRLNNNLAQAKKEMDEMEHVFYGESQNHRSLMWLKGVMRDHAKDVVYNQKKQMTLDALIVQMKTPPKPYKVSALTSAILGFNTACIVNGFVLWGVLGVAVTGPFIPFSVVALLLSSLLTVFFLVLERHLNKKDIAKYENHIRDWDSDGMDAFLNQDGISQTAALGNTNSEEPRPDDALKPHHSSSPVFSQPTSPTSTGLVPQKNGHIAQGPL